ncbi:tyrosine-type recombinase/integrase [Rhizobium leguminosarum]|uniref:tyrosine-type recombinase/integrase n=1 Tax=Rhizobium leguminosarum TaxID=384 RepID=UPI001C96F531|nr:site-specific integrase [Rhizobium leguminosarum]MBY5581878.1 site-specific integrase [Rhizobium leguminosarum]
MIEERGQSFRAKFMVQGQNYVASFAKREEAEDWETETRRRIKRGLPVEQPIAMIGGNGTGTAGNVVNSVIKDYWEPMRGGAGQIANAKYFLKWVGPATTITEAFSEDTQREFRQHLLDEREIAPTTLNRYMSMVRTVCKQAKIKLDFELPHDALAENTNGRTRFFSKAEFETIVAWMDRNGFHRYRDFFIFLCHTGARPWSEGVDVKWPFVFNGKVTFQYTKNSKPRTVPLSPRALVAVDNQRELGLAGPWTGLNCRTMVDFWKVVKANIPGLDDTVMYTCRHTCASWQAQDGVPLYNIGQWLGHTNPMTTQRYAKLSPDHLQANMVAFQ